MNPGSLASKPLGSLYLTRQGKAGLTIEAEEFTAEGTSGHALFWARRAWVRGFTAQAIRPKAAAATRPFMFPSARLYERFPEEIPVVEQLYRDSLTAALELAKGAGQVRPDLNAACDSVFIYDLVKTWLERQLRADPLPPETEIARRADKLENFIMRAIGVT